MFKRLSGRLEWGGSVFYRGDLAPRAEEFAYLQRHGVQMQGVEPLPKGWRATLTHSHWGEATLVCGSGFPLPPRELIDLDPRLTGLEKQELRSAGQGMVSIQMAMDRARSLRERKHALRYLRALMGDDGLAAVDHMAMRFWSRTSLNEELVHDADLDVTSLFTLHNVTVGGDGDGQGGERTVTWAHTHGLADLGAYDFDLLRPHVDALSGRTGLMRALAFAVIEGRLTPDGESMPIAWPDRQVQMVPAAWFQKHAASQDAALRDAEDHEQDRCVACDPQRTPGLIKRLFGRSAAPRPCHWMQREMGEGVIVTYSNEATDLMADRARRTYSVFQEICRELAEFKVVPLAKIGYVVDGGGPTEREHLWVEVHATRDDAIDGTLANQPQAIARLNAGDRGMHPIEQLSDWTVMTPAGQITPSDMLPLRLIRQHADQLRAMIAQRQAEAHA